MKIAFFMLASYIKRLFPDVKLGFIVGKTKQMSDGKEVNIVNWKPLKTMSTKGTEIYMIILELLIQYVYLLTI